MNRLFLVLAALVVSLAIHALGLRALGNASYSETPSADVGSTPNEIQAIAAFAQLDQVRISSARVDNLSQELMNEIVEIETPKIVLPPPVPATRPVVKEQPAQNTQSATAPQQPAKQATPTTNTAQAPRSNAASANQSKQAHSAFAPNVRNALLKALRAPRGVKSGQVVVSIRFRGGRFASATLVQSSGSKAFDDAALSAARKARYSPAPAGLSGDAVFQIAINI